MSFLLRMSLRKFPTPTSSIHTLNIKASLKPEGKSCVRGKVSKRHLKKNRHFDEMNLMM